MTSGHCLQQWKNEVLLLERVVRQWEQRLLLERIVAQQPRNVFVQQWPRGTAPQQ